MTKWKKALAFLAIATVPGIFAGAGIAYAKNTDNDRVLSGEKQQYLEYFKTDKASCNRSDCKNYLYTVSEVPAPKPGTCLIVSGDSEKTLAIACNNGQG